MEHVVTLAGLRDAGMSARGVRAAVSAGELERLRNGWFARPGCPSELARAVRLGGRLTCLSEAGRLGIWVIPDGRLHVAVAPDATRLRSPDDRRLPWSRDEHPDIALHWHPARWAPDARRASESLPNSIGRLLLCQPIDHAVVAIDSALNSRRMSLSELRRTIGTLPAKYARVLDMVDPGSQSGLESLARLRLRRRGLAVETQVPIDGVGHVDVLIGERLVLELDSRAHHLGDGYEKDRSRDLELFRQGFTVLRVSYRRVLYDWASVEAAILEAVRRGEHRRRAMHRRLGLALT